MAVEQKPEREPTPPSPAPTTERAGGTPVVERITHQDVPAVCALFKKVWDAEATGLPSPLVKTWQPTPLEFTSWMEGVTYFAARRSGRVVGVIGCELREGSGHLVHLVVDPESRRQKVATALLAAAVDWAKRANLPEVWADVLGRFTAGRAFFAHLGFSESGVLHKHRWNEDVHLFERVL